MDNVTLGSLAGVDATNPALQIAVPLVSDNDGVVRCIGTGFLVAPGLGITAEHVVADWIEYDEHEYGYKRDTRVGVRAFQVYGDGLLPWDVDESYRAPSADIAFLRFVNPAWWDAVSHEGKIRFPRLSFHAPSVGDKVRVFGFPHSEIRNETLVVSPAICTASVRRVEMNSPGSYRPVAYIEIEGEIKGGMSGGPCFDEDWNVIGINSKGWQLGDGGPPLAYVALLWPAMATEINLFKTGGFPAIELFNKGPARALGYQRVFVTSKKGVHYAKIDPTTLEQAPVVVREEYIEGAVEFAGVNAQRALSSVRVIASNALNGEEALNVSDLHRELRAYFWELEAAMHTSIVLAHHRLSIPAQACEEGSWDHLFAAWKEKEPTPDVKDALHLLDMSWNGEVLFEMRAFADLCRKGPLRVQAVESPRAGIRAIGIDSSRIRGQQLFLPDGLDHYLEHTRGFVHKLLSLTSREP